MDHLHDFLSLEKEYDELEQDYITTTRVATMLNNHIKQGGTELDTNEVYRFLPHYRGAQIGFESKPPTLIGQNIASLEAEKSKFSQFISKLIELLKAFFKSVYNYFFGYENLLKENLNRAKALRESVEAVRNPLDKKQMVMVPIPLWLQTNGEDYQFKNYAQDLTLQANYNSVVIKALRDTFETYIDLFDKVVHGLDKNPKANYFSGIYDNAIAISTLLLKPETKRMGDMYAVQASPLLGGKEFVFLYPIVQTLSQKIERYQTIKLNLTTNDSVTLEPELAVPSLSKEESIFVLDKIIDINEQMSYILSFVMKMDKHIDQFTKDTDNLYKKYGDKLSDEDSELLRAQIVLMLNTLKMIVGFVKRFADINDMTSRTAIRFVTASKAVYTPNP